MQNSANNRERHFWELAMLTPVKIYNLHFQHFFPSEAQRVRRLKRTVREEELQKQVSPYSPWLLRAITSVEPFCLLNTKLFLPPAGLISNNKLKQIHARQR